MILSTSATHIVNDMLQSEQGNHEGEVKAPAAFADDTSKPMLSTEEKQLGRELVKITSTNQFDLAKYKDLHREKLMELIEAKVSGKELVAPPPADEQAKVINLMDALKQSVAKAAKVAPPPRPPKKMAASEPRPPRRAGGKRHDWQVGREQA